MVFSSKFTVGLRVKLAEKILENSSAFSLEELIIEHRLLRPREGAVVEVLFECTK